MAETENIERKWYQKTWFVIALLILVWPVGLILLWMNPFFAKKTKIVVSGIFVVLGLIGFMTKDNTPKQTNLPTTQTSQQSPSSSAQTQKKEEKPPVPREYSNALKSAQNYLKMMPFSKEGLYQQLSSEAGDKYPDEAARYAVENVKTDWKQNALKAAKNYLKIMPMSNAELHQQLTSDAGDKYTEEEADYAIAHLDDK